MNRDRRRQSQRQRFGRVYIMDRSLKECAERIMEISALKQVLVLVFLQVRPVRQET